MSTNEFGKGKVALVVTIVAPIAAIGIAGAVASFYNFTGFLNGQAASALGLVAAGEGAALACALVMLLLTVLGRPTPGVVRAGLWLLPIVAAGVGATLAPDLNMRVTAGVTPLAMTVAGEGIALVMRNVVAYRTGVDLEANRRAGLMVWHVRRANNGSGLGKWLSKGAVWRLARQFAATDSQVSVQLADVQRYRIADGMDAGMAAILDGTADEGPVRPAKALAPAPAPEAPAAPVQAALAPAEVRPGHTVLAPMASPAEAAPAEDDGFAWVKGVMDEAEARVVADSTVLLTGVQAAALANVNDGTIRSWSSRGKAGKGKLRIADRDANGKSLYDPADVVAFAAKD